MSKKKDTTGSNIKPLLVPPAKSTAQVMMVLRDAITHARHHRMKGICVVMIPEDIERDGWVKAAVPLNAVDVNTLLDNVEDAHEVVYQLLTR